MKHLSLTAVVLLLLPCTAVGQTVQQGYAITVRELGGLFPGGTSSALGINNHGDVVGYGTTEQDRQVPFLWTPQHGFERILGDTDGLARDINDQGAVVGDYVAGGFLWTRASGLQHLDNFSPWSLNNLGQIAGFCRDTSEPCVWDHGVTHHLQPLGLPGIALGINELGQVVGSVDHFPADSTGFVWTPGQGLEDVGHLSYQLNDINNHGEFIGFTCCPLASGVWKDGHLRSPNLLGPVGKNPGMVTQAINNLGWVISQSWLDDPAGAFVWIPGVPLIRLPRSFGASALNDHGQIAGNIVSSEPFTSVAAIWTVTRSVPLRIDTPNTNARWGLGTTQRLAWTYAGNADEFQIDISRDSGTTWNFLASIPNAPGNSQNFNWRVEGPLVSAAKFRVTAVGEAPGSATDTNDAGIAIEEAEILFVAPRIRSVEYGSSQRIAFTHNLGARAPIAVEASEDDGQTWRVIRSDLFTTGTTSSSFTGIVDLAPTAHGRLRILALDGSGASATSASFSVIGPKGFSILALPDGSYASATAINNRGDIVGQYPGPVAGRGFLLTAHGQFLELRISGAVYVAPSDINARGEIVGTYMDSVGTHGFFRTADGRVRAIDAPGCLGTVITGINASRSMVGYCEREPQLEGFEYRAGTFTTLEVTGFTEIVPTGISDDGKVVGYFGPLDAPPFGFVIDGTAVTLLSVPGAAYTYVEGISPDGRSIVGFVGNDLDGFVHTAGQYHSLPNHIVPLGINDGSTVVGTVQVRTNRAFAWRDWTPE